MGKRTKVNCAEALLAWLRANHSKKNKMVIWLAECALREAYELGVKDGKTLAKKRGNK